MKLKDSIKRILKEESEKDIFCNSFVRTYEEGLRYLKRYLGNPKENLKEWEKIIGPLKIWKEETKKIRQELKTGMTGDCEPDESYTAWSAIQSTFCKK